MAEFNWQAFHFLRPEYLWLLIPAVLILWHWLGGPKRQDGWQKHCDPELLQAMQLETTQDGSRWQWLYWPVTLIAIIAIAGPAFRQIPVPVVQNQAALIVALDVSRSMLADDIKPSRLERAKFKIQDILTERKDGQTALVVYAGDAFVVTPLTNDTDTITSLLEAIEPSIMPVKGTNTAKALEESAALFAQAGLPNGDILLITDSIAMHKTEDTLNKIHKQNIRTHVLAVGTADGAPIPTPRGFVKDMRGQIVVPKVDFSSLQSAALAGGGHFITLTSNDDFSGIFDTNQDLADALDDEENSTNGHFIDDGPFLALLLLPMLALLYRRGLMLCLAAGMILPIEQSHAVSWNDLWFNKDQQAWQKLQNTEPEAAQSLALDPKLQAAAAYHNKQYQKAADLYRNQANELDKHYNQGNALAQAGKLEEAIESYDQALTIDPENEDTLYNKKIVEDALKQQQQQQQQQDNQQQGDQSDPNQQEQEQSSEQQSEAQSEQQSEQESQEQQQQAQKDQQTETGEEKEQLTEEQQQTQENEPQEVELTPEEQALDAEEKQAMEQWLRRIKDDPGGLLRRKFLYQYHRRNNQGDDYQTTEDW